MTLKEARDGRGWSQVQLAVAAGCTPGTVSRAECGTGVRTTTKRALAAALELPVAELFPGTLTPRIG